MCAWSEGLARVQMARDLHKYQALCRVGNMSTPPKPKPDSKTARRFHARCRCSAAAPPWPECCAWTAAQGGSSGQQESTVGYSATGYNAVGDTTVQYVAPQDGYTPSPGSTPQHTNPGGELMAYPHAQTGDVQNEVGEGTLPGRDRLGRYVKGFSGSPGGRSKAEGEVRRLARSFAPEAIYGLVKLMRGAKSEIVRKQAADSILDRGLGRAFQAEAPSDDEIEEISDVSNEALDQILDS